jgi:cystathionine beta-lyase
MDNTWSAGLFFQPFAHGVDVSFQAATKFIVGHSDAMLGTVTVSASLYNASAPPPTALAIARHRMTATSAACCAAQPRLARHQENGLGWPAGWRNAPSSRRCCIPPFRLPGHDL